MNFQDELLEYLAAMNNGDFVNCSPILRDIVGHNDHKVIIQPLRIMISQFLVEPLNNSFHEIGSMVKGINRDLSNTEVLLKILPLGLNRVAELKRQTKLDELNEALTLSNESNIELNKETKSYYKQLKWATWVIAGATIVTMLSSIGMYLQTKKENQEFPNSEQRQKMRMRAEAKMDSFKRAVDTTRHN